MSPEIEALSLKSMKEVSVFPEYLLNAETEPVDGNPVWDWRLLSSDDFPVFKAELVLKLLRLGFWRLYSFIKESFAEDKDCESDPAPYSETDTEYEIGAAMAGPTIASVMRIAMVEIIR